LSGGTGMRVPPIVTERLELVSMGPEFLEALLAGRRAEAQATLGVKLPDGWGGDEGDRRRLRLRLQQMREDPTVHPWLLRAIVARGEGAFVGHINFHGRPEDGRAELGYTIIPEFRRRGYATEAAQGMMDWARQEHGVARFVVSISPDNAASLAMAEKLGFRQVGTQMDEEDGLELVFELLREE
jgi:RimJ/RimL family protein N-acetyltransferase